MKPIIEKHFRFLTVIVVLLGMYAWHVAATPAPKHPRLHKAWTELKWLAVKAGLLPPAESEAPRYFQSAPPEVYGDLPEREYGDDGEQMIAHDDGW